MNHSARALPLFPLFPPPSTPCAALSQSPSTDVRLNPRSCFECDPRSVVPFPGRLLHAASPAQRVCVQGLLQEYLALYILHALPTLLWTKVARKRGAIAAPLAHSTAREAGCCRCLDAREVPMLFALPSFFPRALSLARRSSRRRYEFEDVVSRITPSVSLLVLDARRSRPPPDVPALACPTACHRCP